MNGTVEVIESNSSGNSIIQHDDAQLDLFFKMQEKINAKNEEISKSYKNNILVKFSDIKELHHKTIQSINSLSPANNSISTRIAVSHSQGESEKLNSFEEFESHNTTSPNPTTDIYMSYSFTIYDSEINAFENYKITNQVRSRVAELEQIENEAPPFISRAIVSGMVTTTAKITIQYGDYVKARHFTAMFDEWVKGCDESKNITLIEGLKRFSHFIPQFGKLVIYALLAIFTVSAIDTNLITDVTAIKFLVAYASVFVIIGGIATVLLRKVELSIDSYLAISYLDINKGDKKLIKDYCKRNSSSLMWAVIGIIGTIVVGWFTSASYDLIKWLVL